jgi:hypothetical protein
MDNFKNKNENLDNLLAKFYSADEAERIKNDFSFADAAFEKFPAVEPDKQTTEEIKQRLAAKLSVQKQTNWPRVVLKTAAVAAIVIAAAVLILPDKSADNVIAKAQRQNLQLVSDTDTSLYEQETSQLHSDLFSLEYGEGNGTNGMLFDIAEQVEIEIIKTNNTFWKG